MSIQALLMSRLVHVVQVFPSNHFVLLEQLKPMGPTYAKFLSFLKIGFELDPLNEKSH